MSEGAVQAAKVLASEVTLSTTERNAYRGALEKLTGAKHKSLRSWRAYWKLNAARLLQKASTTAAVARGTR